MNLILNLMIIGTLSAATPTQPQSALRFGYSEACPHMCPDGTQKGFTTDIVRVIYERKGYQVSFIALPWARASANALSGELDGVLSASKAEAPRLLFPEIELAMQSDCFIGHSADTWQPTDMASFSDRRTIVFSGWLHESEYVKALGKERYRQQFVHLAIDARYPQRAVEMLKRNRVNAFWMDVNVFAYYRTHLPLMRDSHLRNLGCVATQPLFLAITPTRPDRAKIILHVFDEGMETLRQSGELKAILENYGLTDWR